MKHTIATVVTLVLLGTPAFAAPAGADATPPAPDEPGIEVRLPPVKLAAPPTATPAYRDIKLKSPGAAVTISLLSTLIPAGIALALIPFQPIGAIVVGSIALSLGPSMGHFYADNLAHGAGFFALRAVAGGAGVGMFMLGALAAFGGSPGLAYAGFINAAMIGGGLITLAIYDIATAGKAARRANERAKRRVSFAPTIGRDPMTGATRYGVAMAGTF